MTAIGIDLGTTYSCVAVHRNDRIEIIANDEGCRVTPSYVSFNDSERLIGETARADLSDNLENTLFQIKRLIGRTYDDPNVQKDLKLWGFKVINDRNRPKIQVEYMNEVKTFYPEQISAMVLSLLKEAAEAFLGTTVTDAVITVPAYFNDAQRKETRNAGRIAGLNVLYMLNEPTAAAIAYGLENKDRNGRNILIFDLGGGTFDVTVMTIKDQIFDVQATGGDTHLGGEDFDNRMVDYYSNLFNRKHGVNMKNNKRAMSKLRVECEKAKRKLSVALQAKLQIDSLFNGMDFKETISRAKFEDINSDYFEKTIETVKETLSEANIDKEKIDDVVLVGGSTRIPKIREMLQKLFSGKTLYKTINPDEAVAYGAAAQAENMKSGKFTLRDVVPLSLGVEIVGDFMRVVVKKNTKIPTKQSINVTTRGDNQTRLRFSVYQGERPRIRDNMFLGSFHLEGIPPAPRRVPSIDLSFNIDSNGILNVTALDAKTGKKNQINIAEDKRRVAAKDIVKMTEEAEKYKKDDEEFKEQNKARNDLENLTYSIKQSAEDDSLKDKISEEEISLLLRKSSETLNWLEVNKKLNSETIRQKQTELESVSHPIFTRLYRGEKVIPPSSRFNTLQQKGTSDSDTKRRSHRKDWTLPHQIAYSSARGSLKTKTKNYGRFRSSWSPDYSRFHLTDSESDKKDKQKSPLSSYTRENERGKKSHRASPEHIYCSILTSSDSDNDFESRKMTPLRPAHRRVKHERKSQKSEPRRASPNPTYFSGLSSCESNEESESKQKCKDAKTTSQHDAEFPESFDRKKRLVRESFRSAGENEVDTSNKMKNFDYVLGSLAGVMNSRNERGKKT